MQSAQSTRWNIDVSHSAISFSVRHMVVSKVRGKFTKWAGTLTMPDGDLAGATADVTIEAASIDTGVADRDGHLRSADFFDVERFPTLTFHGMEMEATGADRWKLRGVLTIRDVAREVVLDVELGGRTTDPWGNERVGFSARTSIDRRDFGLTWSQLLETGGLVVGERVDIELDIEAVRAVEKAA